MANHNRPANAVARIKPSPSPQGVWWRKGGSNIFPASTDVLKSRTGKEQNDGIKVQASRKAVDDWTRLFKFSGRTAKEKQVAPARGVGRLYAFDRVASFYAAADLPRQAPHGKPGDKRQQRDHLKKKFQDAGR